MDEQWLSDDSPWVELRVKVILLVPGKSVGHFCSRTAPAVSLPDLKPLPNIAIAYLRVRRLSVSIECFLTRLSLFD